MPEPRLKSHKRHIFYRFFCPLAIAASPVSFFGLALWIGEGGSVPLYAVVIFAALWLALWMVSHLHVFPFDYSIFGRYQRTPFPEEEPLTMHFSLYGRIGCWPWLDICTWYVFPSGLGIFVPFYGRAFMPVKNMLRLEKGYSLGGAKLIHNSPEFRSRVILPISWVTKAVENIMEARDARADAG